jgi:hypothetical protein
MSKSKYAHFFVQKMLRYGTKEQRAHIFKTMEGNIAKVMGRIPHFSAVLIQNFEGLGFVVDPDPDQIFKEISEKIAIFYNIE